MPAGREPGDAGGCGGWGAPAVGWLAAGWGCNSCLSTAGRRGAARWAGPSQHTLLCRRVPCSPPWQGESLDGHDIDLLRVGEDTEGKRKIWVVARQHPGETMAEWFMEGLMRRLLDPADPTSRKLLRTCVFYCVPCMW